MTIEELINIHRKYSYISVHIKFKLVSDIIMVEDIKSINILSGFGDTQPFYDELYDTDWNTILTDFQGDGFYSLDILYKNELDSDDYRSWFIYDLLEIKSYKHHENELFFENTIPFEWTDLSV
jgi:hypothetical protein